MQSIGLYLINKLTIKIPMKRIYLFTIAFMSFVSTFAQDWVNDPKIIFGIKTGATFPTFEVSGADAKGVVPSSITSFYAGLTANMHVTGILSIQPGLSLVGKGASLSSSSGTTTQLTLLYIETPINVMANFETSHGTIFVGAGPYWDFVIGGTLSVTSKADTNIEFGSDFNDDIRSGDFGFNFLLGYQLKNGINIHTGYGLGLTNIQPDATLDKKYKNSVLSLGLGFSF